MDFSSSSLVKLEKMRDTLTEKVQREQERAKNTPIGSGLAADPNRKSMEQRYTEQLDVIEEAIFKAEMADMEQQNTTSTADDALADTTTQETGGSVGDIAAKVRAATETTSSSGISLHTAPAAAASSVKPQHNGIPAPSQSAPLTANTPTAVCRERKFCGYFRSAQGCKKGNACNLAHVDRIWPADTPCGAFESRKKAGDSVNTESRKEVVQARTLTAAVQQHDFVEGAENEGEDALLPRPLVPSQPQVGPPDLHPCIRVFGKCKVGDNCRYARYPRDSCLRHLKAQVGLDGWGTEKGRECIGYCTDRHVVWEGDEGPKALRDSHEERKHPCLRGNGIVSSWQGCAWKTKPSNSINCPYVNYPRDACMFHLKSQCEGAHSCHKDKCPYPHVDFVGLKTDDGWGDDGWGDSSDQQPQPQGKPPQPKPQAPPPQQTKTFDVAKQVVDFVRDGASIRDIEADTECVVTPPPKGKTGIEACRIDISGPNNTAVKNAFDMILRQSRDKLLHPCLRVYGKCAYTFCRYAKYPRNCCLFHLISQRRNLKERRPSKQCLDGDSCRYPHIDWQGVDGPRASTVNSTMPQSAGGASSALPAGWGDEGGVSPEQHRLWQQGYQNGATSNAGSGEPVVASGQQGQNGFRQGDYWQPQPRPQSQQPFSTHQPHEQEQLQQPTGAPSNVARPPGTPHATALLQPLVLPLDQQPPQHATGATTQQTPSSVPHSNGNHSLLPPPPPPPAANAQQQPLGSLDQQELLPPGVATFRPPPPPPVITPTALNLPPPTSSVGVPLAPDAVLSTATEWRIVPSGPPPLVATAAGGQPYLRERRDRSRSRHHQHERSASSRDDERRAHERRKRSRSRGESRKHRSSYQRRDETEQLNVGTTKYDLL